MKKGRISMVYDSEIHNSSPSFSDLPKDVMLNIFSRLFIDRALLCKSVCKTWRDLISDPLFAKIHFDSNRNQACPLIHASDDFDAKGPRKNLVIALFPTIFHYSGFNVNPPYGGGNNNGYFIGNSCNGLLCLSHRSEIRPVIICNPITSEFIELPECEKVDLCRAVRYYLGYSHVANQYKVLRMIAGQGVTTEVHVVGTESWRDIGSKPEHFPICSPTYLNGCLYWPSLSSYLNYPLSLATFDIENECFGLELGPEIKPTCSVPSMGMLGGDLCVSLIMRTGTFEVWSRNVYGVEKVWSKVYSIEMDSHGHRILNSFEPMKNLNDGSLLLFSSNDKSLVHIDGTKHTFRFLKTNGKKPTVGAVFPHIPSLVSLKHSLTGHNVKVLDLQSRCEELKLLDLVNDLRIVEEEFPVYNIKALDLIM